MDTGAPGLPYLGTKPLDILRKLNLIREVYYKGFQYLVNGVLTCGDSEITPVFASNILPAHESSEVYGDIRSNLLGLEGILALEVLNTGSKLTQGIDVD